MKAVMNHPGNDSIKNQAYVHFWTVILYLVFVDYI